MAGAHVTLPFQNGVSGNQVRWQNAYFYRGIYEESIVGNAGLGIRDWNCQRAE